MRLSPRDITNEPIRFTCTIYIYMSAASKKLMHKLKICVLIVSNASNSVFLMMQLPQNVAFLLLSGVAL